MLHKIFHGFGYNHQDMFYRQVSLLGWQVGVPYQTDLMAVLIDEDQESCFLSKHLLQVLGIYEPGRFADNCIDCKGFKSITDSSKKGSTQNVWDSKCMDFDGDNIPDANDDYFLSSLVGGQDSDGDGITDSPDLCPWNQITVSGTNLKIGKINLVGTDKKCAIRFDSNSVDIFKIKFYTCMMVLPIYKTSGISLYFPESRSMTVNGNTITISKTPDSAPANYIQVHYRYDGQEYYRPYYFYHFGDKVLNVFNEREWYYFGRAGWDVPADIDLYNVKSYDSNFDGIYDKFKLPDGYDWDGDGVPDINDSLAVVPGNFKNEYVAGVPDSDSDGLADPGGLDFSTIEVPQEYFFGEITRTIGKNPDWDRSPYLPRTKKNRGRPVLNNNDAN